MSPGSYGGYQSFLTFLVRETPLRVSNDPPEWGDLGKALGRHPEPFGFI